MIVGNSREVHDFDAEESAAVAPVVVRISNEAMRGKPWWERVLSSHMPEIVGESSFQALEHMPTSGDQGNGHR